MRKITLCADDFGQNAAISKGIIHLVQEKRLSAVSCMTNCMSFKEYAKELKPFSDQIEIGLHFNLTHDTLLTSYNHQQPFTLNSLLLKAFTHKLSFQHICDELTAQIQMFATYFDCLPAFIDGHQHIHQFPVIRDAVIAIYNSIVMPAQAGIHRTYKTNKSHMDASLRWHDRLPYIRMPTNLSLKNIFNKNNFLKKHIIMMTGSLKLKQLLIKHNIPHNTSFSGIYDFKNAINFRDYFLKFLTEIDNHGIIMCHPGDISDDNTDPLKNYRVHELNYLCSQQFLDDCAEYKIQLAPFLGGK
jgi:predicted glycoside hydrolase/deacetylase ChbG (UPF0249 family)